MEHPETQDKVNPLRFAVDPETVKTAINAQAQALKEMAEALEALPADQRGERYAQAVAALDGQTIGQAATAVARLLMVLRRENPDLIDRTGPAMEAAVKATDFGKLREGVVVLADYEADAVIRFFDLAMADPVVIANLLGIAAPLLNNALRVLAYALIRLDMPAEVVASSIFNILSDVDRKALGQTLTGLARLVNDLHEGSRVLGRDEPRFREVFTKIAEGVLEDTDFDQVGAALIALSEDMEVVHQVAADLMRKDPNLLIRTVAAALAFHNAALRGVTAVTEQAARLPDEALARLGETVQNGLDGADLGRALNGMTELARRLNEQNPDRVDAFAAEVLAALDVQSLGATLGDMAARTAGAAAADPGLKRALRPEDVGRRVNDAVVRFNAHMQKAADGPGDYLSQVMAGVDGRELQQAVRHVVNLITRGLFSKAGKGMALIRPMAAGAWRMFTFSLSSLKRKLLGG